MPETPPLTRGRLARLERTDRRSGNTPAYAGKTREAHSASTRRQKHPRLRGEDSSEGSQNRFQVETPPLTRGRPPRQGEDHHGLGNTPAYAGKTQQRDRARRRRSKHPRLRGEDVLFAIQKQRDLETPPLTRGRQCSRGRRVRTPGNTPAYAGKTTARPSARGAPEKHPRLRGEDRTTRLRRRGVSGNTPAYAGKTPLNPRLPIRYWKHPRLRGEDCRSGILC